MRKEIIEIRKYKLLFTLFIIPIYIAGCRSRVPAPESPFPIPTTTSSPTPTSMPTQVPTSTSSPTPSSSPTPTPAPSRTPSTSSIPGDTLTPLTETTPSPSLTSTFDFPSATILMQANCRYGPGTAYLYSHGLYKGDHAEVHGRNYSSGWLWIKPENLDRHCWAAASVMEVNGDVSTLAVVQSRLPHSTLYGPPTNVNARRDGDNVLVSWNRVWMTEDDDRGYMIEATVCQDGHLVPIAVQTNEDTLEIMDESNCSGGSSGILYTVEKHGYTDPVSIPWP